MKNKMNALLVVCLLAASFDVSSVNGPFSCARRCRRVANAAVGAAAVGAAVGAVGGVGVLVVGGGGPVGGAAQGALGVVVGAAVGGAVVGLREPLFNPFIDPPGEEQRIARLDARAREAYRLFKQRASRGLANRF